ncbi:MAG TPA: hypothetical protein VL970_01370 [Candidatus Acidoferrales bacterium]|nr:hypothetical protein [Candidatus Acidoferrales bacterium]
MILITSNQHRRLLCLNYVQRVSPAELAAARDEMKALLADLPAGFQLLADLSQLEFMDPDSVTELGKAMDLFDQREVSLIVRVIPDASKDIGLNILTIFHYPHHPRVITCQNLAEALQRIADWR